MSLLALLDSSLTATGVGNATLRSRWGLTLPPRMYVPSRRRDTAGPDHLYKIVASHHTLSGVSLHFELTARSRRAQRPTTPCPSFVLS